MHFRNIAIPLTLATPALAGVLAHTTTSTTVSLWVEEATPAPSHEPEPAHEASKPEESAEGHNPSPSCHLPKPHEVDRHWDDERILNDTTKHHRNFQLFAVPKGAEKDNVRFPIHLKEHASRKDIWTLNTTIHIPQSDLAGAQQPRWNLKQGGLQTDNSAPINDTLYFRLFESGWKRDTRAWAAKKGAYLPVLTTNPNKKTYHREHNAKLVGRDG